MSQDVLMPTVHKKINYSSVIVKNAILFAGVTIIVLIASYLIIFGKNSADLLIEHMLHRQQIVARSGASSIEATFDIIGSSFTFLAKRPSIISQTPDNEEMLDNFIDSWVKTPLTGIVYVGSEGIVIFNSNKDRIRDIGGERADREFFIWSKTAKLGEYKSFQPIISRGGTTKGTSIIPIATPVISASGEYRGVLVGSIPISRLTSQFTDHLKISDATKTYIVDSDGTVVVSPIADLTGVNYLEVIKESNFLGSEKVSEAFKNSLASPEDGTLDVVLPDSENGGKLERFLIAHSPVKVDGSYWHMVVVTPAKDALVYGFPFYIKQVIMLLILFSIFTLFVIRISKIVGYSEGASSEHKLHKGTE